MIDGPVPVDLVGANLVRSLSSPSLSLELRSLAKVLFIGSLGLQDKFKPLPSSTTIGFLGSLTLFTNQKTRRGMEQHHASVPLVSILAACTTSTAECFLHFSNLERLFWSLRAQADGDGRGLDPSPFLGGGNSLESMTSRF